MLKVLEDLLITNYCIFEGQIPPHIDLRKLVAEVIRWPLKRLIAAFIDADQKWDSYFAVKDSGGNFHLIL